MEKNKSIFNLLVLLSRSSILSVRREDALAIIEAPEFNWDMLVAISFKQKVAGLVFKNIRELNLSDNVPIRCYNILRHFYYGNKERNKIIFESTSELMNAFKKEGIDVRPLKGRVLIPLVYKDYGCRVMNDADFFIDKDQAKRLKVVMENNDYIMGEYSRTTDSITPLPKEQILMWQMKMFNIPAYRKRVESDHLDVVNIDFTFGLSYSDDKKIYKEIMSQGEMFAGHYSLSRFDFLIHLCCHLYKEASNVAWVELNQDINLIKFCDIREFFLARLPINDIPLLIARIKELKVHKPVYFALHHTHQIYNDAQLMDLINAIGIENTDFMDNIYQQGETSVSERVIPVSEMVTNI